MCTCRRSGRRFAAGLIVGKTSSLPVRELFEEAEQLLAALIRLETTWSCPSGVMAAVASPGRSSLRRNTRFPARDRSRNIIGGMPCPAASSYGAEQDGATVISSLRSSALWHEGAHLLIPLAPAFAAEPFNCIGLLGEVISMVFAWPWMLVGDPGSCARPAHRVLA